MHVVTRTIAADPVPEIDISYSPRMERNLGHCDAGRHRWSLKLGSFEHRFDYAVDPFRADTVRSTTANG
jgi:hypothetical protein